MKEKLKITKNNTGCSYNITKTYTFTDFEDFNNFITKNSWKKHQPEIEEIGRNRIEKDGFYQLNEYMDISNLIDYWEENISNPTYSLTNPEFVYSCYHLDENIFWLIYNNLHNFYKLDYVTARNTPKTDDEYLPDFMIRLNILKSLLDRLEKLYIKYKTQCVQSEQFEKFEDYKFKIHCELSKKMLS